MRKKSLSNRMKNRSEACQEGFNGAYRQYAQNRGHSLQSCNLLRESRCDLFTRKPIGKKRQWRQRIIEVWGYDPMKCPCCSGCMRVVATVESSGSILAILTKLAKSTDSRFDPLLEPFESTSIRAPRAPPSTVRWMVDAVDGQVINLDPEQDARRMPTAQHYPWPKERFRYEYPESEQTPASQEPPQVEQLDN